MSSHFCDVHHFASIADRVRIVALLTPLSNKIVHSATNFVCADFDCLNDVSANISCASKGTLQSPGALHFCSIDHLMRRFGTFKASTWATLVTDIFSK